MPNGCPPFLACLLVPQVARNLDVGGCFVGQGSRKLLHLSKIDVPCAHDVQFVVEFLLERAEVALGLDMSCKLAKFFDCDWVLRV